VLVGGTDSDPLSSERVAIELGTYSDLPLHPGGQVILYLFCGEYVNAEAYRAAEKWISLLRMGIRIGCRAPCLREFLPITCNYSTFDAFGPA